MIERYLTLCWQHPRRPLIWASVVTVLLCMWGFPQLNFTASRDTLFKASASEMAQRQEFERRFGGWKELVLVLDGGPSSEREQAVNEYSERLRESGLAQEIRGTLELPELDSIGLYYLETEELRQVEQALKTYRPILESMANQGWYGFLAQAARRKDSGSTPSKHRQRLADCWRAATERKSELTDLFPRVDLPQRTYFQDGDTRHIIFFQSEDPLAVQAMLKGVHSQYRGRVVLTGQPLLQALERQESVRDALISTVLSILVVQFILVKGFRETGRPRLGFLSLVYGLLWSVAWAGIVVGTLNIITINFLSITVGLGVDFSIHILARYSEERENQDAVPAMLETLRTTGLENLIGALATSLAFGVLILTDFAAVQQLGKITGVAVPLCFLSVVSLYPPLLFWWEQRTSDPGRALKLTGLAPLERLEQGLRAQPKRTLTLSALVVVVLLGVGLQVRFDYNLLNLQSPNSEAVAYEKEGGFNSLAGFVVADSSRQARRLKLELEALPSVAEVQTVAELLPEDVKEKQALVEAIVSLTKALPSPSFKPDAPPEWTRLEALAKSLESSDQPDFVNYLKNAGPGPVGDVWQRMQNHLHQQLSNTLNTLRNQNPKLDLAAWKERSPGMLRLTSTDGKTLLRIRAKGVLWQRDVLDTFTSEVSSVTDQAMGPPFLIRSYLEQMRDSYYAAVRYAVLAIVLLLLLHFHFHSAVGGGALVPTGIALVPKIVGAIGMFAAMALAGISLNPANCMALPLTLGIGLVFGIHAVHRCLEAPDEMLVSGPTGRAIALSGLTTMASFGTLMSATHPGIFSLGFVMASGVGANMLATYLLVPPLIVLFRERLS